MKLRNMVAPVVFGAFGLAAMQANAGTLAGTDITNTASLEFRINGTPQTAVTASKTFKVDIRLDFLVNRAAGAVATTSADPIQLPGEGSEKFYLVGSFDLTNETNAPLVLNLAANDTTGTTVNDGSNSYADNINLQTADAYKIFLSDASGDATGNALTELSFTTEGESKEVLVFANATDVVGQDEDVLVVGLTASGKEVTVDGVSSPVSVPSDDSNTNTDDGVQFVFADGSDAALGGNSETANDALALILASLPTDPTDPTDTTKNALIKKSTVVWDPINGQRSSSVDPKAIPGAVIKYDLEVRNLGRGSAKDIVVVDNIPASTTYCTTEQVGANGNFSCPVLAVTGTSADIGSDPVASQSTSQATFNGRNYPAAANGTVFVHYPAFVGAATPGDAKLSTITFYVVVD